MFSWWSATNTKAKDAVVPNTLEPTNRSTIVENRDEIISERDGSESEKDSTGSGSVEPYRHGSLDSDEISPMPSRDEVSFDSEAIASVDDLAAYLTRKHFNFEEGSFSSSSTFDKDRYTLGSSLKPNSKAVANSNESFSSSQSGTPAVLTAEQKRDEVESQSNAESATSLDSSYLPVGFQQEERATLQTVSSNSFSSTSSMTNESDTKPSSYFNLLGDGKAAKEDSAENSNDNISLQDNNYTANGDVFVAGSVASSAETSNIQNIRYSLPALVSSFYDESTGRDSLASSDGKLAKGQNEQDNTDEKHSPDDISYISGNSAPRTIGEPKIDAVRPEDTSSKSSTAEFENDENTPIMGEAAKAGKIKTEKGTADKAPHKKNNRSLSAQTKKEAEQKPAHELESGSTSKLGGGLAQASRVSNKSGEKSETRRKGSAAKKREGPSFPMLKEGSTLDKQKHTIFFVPEHKEGSPMSLTTTDSPSSLSSLSSVSKAKEAEKPGRSWMLNSGKKQSQLKLKETLKESAYADSILSHKTSTSNSSDGKKEKLHLSHNEPSATQDGSNQAVSSTEKDKIDDRGFSTLDVEKLETKPVGLPFLRSSRIKTSSQAGANKDKITGNVNVLPAAREPAAVTIKEKKETPVQQDNELSPDNDGSEIIISSKVKSKISKPERDGTISSDAPENKAVSAFLRVRPRTRSQSPIVKRPSPKTKNQSMHSSRNAFGTKHSSTKENSANENRTGSAKYAVNSDSNERQFPQKEDSKEKDRPSQNNKSRRGRDDAENEQHYIDHTPAETSSTLVAAQKIDPSPAETPSTSVSSTEGLSKSTRKSREIKGALTADTPDQQSKSSQQATIDYNKTPRKRPALSRYRSPRRNSSIKMTTINEDSQAELDLGEGSRSSTSKSPITGNLLRSRKSQGRSRSQKTNPRPLETTGTSLSDTERISQSSKTKQREERSKTRGHKSKKSPASSKVVLSRLKSPTRTEKTEEMDEDEADMYRNLAIANASPIVEKESIKLLESFESEPVVTVLDGNAKPQEVTTRSEKRQSMFSGQAKSIGDQRNHFRESEKMGDGDHQVVEQDTNKDRRERSRMSNVKPLSRCRNAPQKEAPKDVAKGVRQKRESEDDSLQNESVKNSEQDKDRDKRSNSSSENCEKLTSTGHGEGVKEKSISGSASNESLFSLIRSTKRERLKPAVTQDIDENEGLQTRSPRSGKKSRSRHTRSPEPARGLQAAEKTAAQSGVATSKENQDVRTTTARARSRVKSPGKQRSNDNQTSGERKGREKERGGSKEEQRSSFVRSKPTSMDRSPSTFDSTKQILSEDHRSIQEKHSLVNQSLDDDGNCAVVTILSGSKLEVIDKVQEKEPSSLSKTTDMPEKSLKKTKLKQNESETPEKQRTSDAAIVRGGKETQVTKSFQEEETPSRRQPATRPSSILRKRRALQTKSLYPVRFQGNRESQSAARSRRSSSPRLKHRWDSNAHLVLGQSENSDGPIRNAGTSKFYDPYPDTQIQDRYAASLDQKESFQKSSGERRQSVVAPRGRETQTSVEAEDKGEIGKTLKTVKSDSQELGGQQYVARSEVMCRQRVSSSGEGRESPVAPGGRKAQNSIEAKDKAEVGKTLKTVKSDRLELGDQPYGARSEVIFRQRVSSSVLRSGRKKRDKYSRHVDSSHISSILGSAQLQSKANESVPGNEADGAPGEIVAVSPSLPRPKGLPPAKPLGKETHENSFGSKKGSSDIRRRRPRVPEIARKRSNGIYHSGKTNALTSKSIENKSGSIPHSKNLTGDDDNMDHVSDKYSTEYPTPSVTVLSGEEAEVEVKMDDGQSLTEEGPVTSSERNTSSELKGKRRTRTKLGRSTSSTRARSLTRSRGNSLFGSMSSDSSKQPNTSTPTRLHQTEEVTDTRRERSYIERLSWSSRERSSSRSRSRSRRTESEKSEGSGDKSSLELGEPEAAEKKRFIANKKSPSFREWHSWIKRDSERSQSVPGGRLPSTELKQVSQSGQSRGVGTAELSSDEERDSIKKSDAGNLRSPDKGNTSRTQTQETSQASSLRKADFGSNDQCGLSKKVNKKVPLKKLNNVETESEKLLSSGPDKATITVLSGSDTEVFLVEASQGAADVPTTETSSSLGPSVKDRAQRFLDRFSSPKRERSRSQSRNSRRAGDESSGLPSSKSDTAKPPDTAVFGLSDNELSRYLPETSSKIDDIIEEKIAARISKSAKRSEATTRSDLLSSRTTEGGETTSSSLSLRRKLRPRSMRGGFPSPKRERSFPRSRIAGSKPPAALALTKSDSAKSASLHRSDLVSEADASESKPQTPTSDVENQSEDQRANSQAITAIVKSSSQGKPVKDRARKLLNRFASPKKERSSSQLPNGSACNGDQRRESNESFHDLSSASKITESEKFGNTDTQKKKGTNESMRNRFLSPKRKSLLSTNKEAEDHEKSRQYSPTSGQNEEEVRLADGPSRRINLISRIRSINMKSPEPSNESFSSESGREVPIVTVLSGGEMELIGSEDKGERETDFEKSPGLVQTDNRKSWAGRLSSPRSDRFQFSSKKDQQEVIAGAGSKNQENAPCSSSDGPRDVQLQLDAGKDDTCEDHEWRIEDVDEVAVDDVNEDDGLESSKRDKAKSKTRSFLRVRGGQKSNITDNEKREPRIPRFLKRKLTSRKLKSTDQSPCPSDEEQEEEPVVVTIVSASSMDVLNLSQSTTPGKIKGTSSQDNAIKKRVSFAMDLEEHVDEIERTPVKNWKASEFGKDTQAEGLDEEEGAVEVVLPGEFLKEIQSERDSLYVIDYPRDGTTNDSDNTEKSERDIEASRESTEEKRYAELDRELLHTDKNMISEGNKKTNGLSSLKRSPSPKKDINSKPHVKKPKRVRSKTRWESDSNDSSSELPDSFVRYEIMDIENLRKQSISFDEESPNGYNIQDDDIIVGKDPQFAALSLSGSEDRSRRSASMKLETSFDSDMSRTTTPPRQQTGILRNKGRYSNVDTAAYAESAMDTHVGRSVPNLIGGYVVPQAMASFPHDMHTNAFEKENSSQLSGENSQFLHENPLPQSRSRQVDYSPPIPNVVFHPQHSDLQRGVAGSNFAVQNGQMGLVLPSTYDQEHGIHLDKPAAMSREPELFRQWSAIQSRDEVGLRSRSHHQERIPSTRDVGVDAENERNKSPQKKQPKHQGGAKPDKSSRDVSPLKSLFRQRSRSTSPVQESRKKKHSRKPKKPSKRKLLQKPNEADRSFQESSFQFVSADTEDGLDDSLPMDPAEHEHTAVAMEVIRKHAARLGVSPKYLMAAIQNMDNDNSTKEDERQITRQSSDDSRSNTFSEDVSAFHSDINSDGASTELESVAPTAVEEVMEIFSDFFLPK